MKTCLAALAAISLSLSPARAGLPSVPAAPVQSAVIVDTNGNAAPLSPLLTPLSTNRLPGANDDAAHGRAVGDAWLAPSGLYVAARVNAGAAVWQRVNPPLPCDAAPSLAASACYGVRRMASAYAGSAFRLMRGSDSSTQTVGFVASGFADFATANNFCNAKGDAAANTCYVTTVYDQSGNGYNATASAGANAPLWNPVSLVGAIQAISLASISHGIFNQSQTSRYLTLSTSLSWTISTATVLMAGQVQNTNENHTFVENASNVGFLMSYGSQMCNKGNGVCTSLSAEASPAVFSFQWQAGVVTVFSNNRTATHASTTTGAGTGGYIGSNQAGFCAQMDMLGLVIYAASTTSAQVNAARYALYQAFAIAPQAADYILVQDGDSTSSGAGSFIDYSTLRYSAPSFNRPTTMFNEATFGYTLANAYSGFATRVAPLYSASAKAFIVHILAGANDMRAGTLAGPIYTSLQSYVNAVHALGANAKVIVSTEPVQCDMVTGANSYSAQEPTYNNAIRAGWNVPQALGGLGADGLADYQADPTIGPNTYASSYFCTEPGNSPDGAHPTDNTMTYFAPIEGAAVNAILNRY